MRRILFLALLLVIPFAAAAADAPVVDTEFPEGEVIVGQPAVLRITVLVPSWMPEPPVWPALEVPGLMVRLPERASTPVSRRIDGATWSGVSRAYRLYPLEARGYDIPAQAISVVYADPDTPSRTVSATPTLGPFAFRAVLPAGAGDLSPPIVAGGFALEQQIDGAAGLRVGDAITRTVTATIEGTTPVLIPALVPPAGPGPLRAYPSDPTVTESEQRSTLSGTRRETVTYVAQKAGTAALPAISFDWFDLGTGRVETATLDGVELTVAEPPPPPPGPGDYLRIGLIAAAALIAAALAWRFLRPPVIAWFDRVRTAWLGSEPRAARQVRHALQRGDLGAIYAAVEHWLAFFPGITGTGDLMNRIAALGAVHHARASESESGADMSDSGGGDRALRLQALSAFVILRGRVRADARRAQRPGRLPPLNP